MAPVAAPKMEAPRVLLACVPGLRQARHEVHRQRAALILFQKQRGQAADASRHHRRLLGSHAWECVAQLAPHQVVAAGEASEEHAQPHRLFAVEGVFLAKQLLELQHLSRVFRAQQPHPPGEHRDPGADHVCEHETPPPARRRVPHAGRAGVAARTPARRTGQRNGHATRGAGPITAASAFPCRRLDDVVGTVAVVERGGQQARRGLEASL
mmetsp:Transcript_27651/g.69284  ORF Transcript_27651/g.69284 Transcript_27651/m.69284 type:complete len:211 (-) Transcript_27651:105-737(-)